MKKLSDYIQNETKKINDLNEIEERQKINTSMQMQDFRENFSQAVFENLKNQLLKLKSTNRNEFDINDISSTMENEPFLLEMELSVFLKNLSAQYFIKFQSDFSNYPDGITLFFEISGVDKKIERHISFEEIRDLNLEDYLVNLLEEINN